MRRTSLHGVALLALAPLAAAWAAEPIAAQALPEDVFAALAAPECQRLGTLNKHYWSLPQDAARDQAIAALEAAILDLPACGVVKAELVRAEPVRGVNPFDFRAPLGGPGPRR